MAGQLKRPWLVMYRRTSWRTGNLGKWRVLATYATRDAAIDGMLKHTTDRVEAMAIHRDRRAEVC